MCGKLETGVVLYLMIDYSGGGQALSCHNIPVRMGNLLLNLLDSKVLTLIYTVAVYCLFCYI